MAIAGIAGALGDTRVRGAIYRTALDRGQGNTHAHRTQGYVLAGHQRSGLGWGRRYAAFPALVLVLGAGVWRLAALSPRRPGAIAAAAFALVAVVSGWSIYNLATDTRYAKEDCRALGALLTREARSGDLILVSARYMEAAVRFYYGGPAEVVGYDPPSPPDAHDAPDAHERAATQLGGLIDGHHRVWLVRTRAFHGDREGIVPAVLTSRLDAGDVYAFPGVEVQRFMRR
jgi:hypothetical protein